MRRLNSLLWSVPFVCALMLGCGGGDKSDPDAPSNKNPKKQQQSENGEQPGANHADASRSLGIQSEPFGTLTIDDEELPVQRYLLTNSRGMTVSIIDYGAIVQSVFVPDRDGKVENVTLGFDSLDGYTSADPKDPYFGAICGRYSNRIAKGKFTLDGKEYTLATNNDPNHLHGGDRGYNDVLWQSRPLNNELTEGNAVGVELTYVSPDGEEGYPGTVTAKVIYTLNDENELKIEYTATTTAPTPINLTNHCYWNIGGIRLATPAASDEVTQHVLQMKCDRYLPVDETMIPTGEMKPVSGTPFDFTTAKSIGKDFPTVKGDAKNGGYDHCWLVTGWKENEPPRHVATLSDPASGRVMEIHTDQPGLQFYTGNFLSGGPGDAGFPQHHACCLETQKLPDSPNQSEFPSAILKPGEVYRHVTIHRFSTDGDAAKQANDE